MGPAAFLCPVPPAATHTRLGLPDPACREAEELASAAVAAGADAEAVEAALVLTGGNWQAAIDTLLSSQECSAPAGSTATAEVRANRGWGAAAACW